MPVFQDARIVAYRLMAFLKVENGVAQVSQQPSSNSVGPLAASTVIVHNVMVLALLLVGQGVTPASSGAHDAYLFMTLPGFQTLTRCGEPHVSDDRGSDEQISGAWTTSIVSCNTICLIQNFEKCTYAGPWKKHGYEAINAQRSFGKVRSCRVQTGEDQHPLLPTIMRAAPCFSHVYRSNLTMHKRDKPTSGYTAPATDILRPFVPSRNFVESQRFYQAIGFHVRQASQRIAVVSLDAQKGLSFLLQDYYDQRLAENLMLQMIVPDLALWWTHLSGLCLDKRFAVKAPQGPTNEAWGGKVAYFWDPAGVLWHVTSLVEKRYET